MLHLHEVHKLVYDLIERQAFELAHQIAGLYMDPFDNGELRFNHLWLLVKDV